MLTTTQIVCWCLGGSLFNLNILKMITRFSALAAVWVHEKLTLRLFLSKSTEKAIFMAARPAQATGMNPSTILLF
jgi:hypothetical protein